MALLLYINGQLADLDAGAVIAQTRQVNDLNSLDNRQASYTNKFSLPKTATNVRIMQFLTLTGNNSPVPYQKNECSLYSASGECFVYKGWAVITDGGDSYEAVIYDGIIDLYKTIENKTLADLDLSALTHDKNVDNIKATWDNDLPYRYILTDYNGSSGTSGGLHPIVNIDYMVPAVKVSWLWEKIFEKYNYNTQPQGSVFNTFNFKELWLTYPKGVTTVESEEEVFKSENYTITGNYGAPRHFLKFIDAETNTLLNYTDNVHLAVQQAGNYSLTVSGNIAFLFNGSNRRLFIGKNAAGMGINSIVPFYTLAENFGGNFVFNLGTNFHLSEWESICLVIDGAYIADLNLTVTLTKVNASSIDFSAALADFSIRDFLTEVVHRFGLTMYTKKDTHDIEFLTLQEVLQTPQVQDWSSKFSKKLNENYVYGNYAQLNWFRYQYNDKESDYNDGCIEVKNVNLADSRNAIKSKIYSPERQPVTYLGQQHRVYRLWDKEYKEGTDDEPDTVTYKPLDKRYYFMRATENQRSSYIRVLSLQYLDSANVRHFYTESYYKLSFPEILQEYYGPLQNILTNATIVTAELWLTDHDVANFDFKKLYYIEQLSNYYLVNKINNYIPGKTTKCELIKVADTADAPPQVSQSIYTINTILREGTNGVRIFFSNILNPYIATLQSSRDNSTWSVSAYIYEQAESPLILTAQAAGIHYFRIMYYEYTPTVSQRFSNTVSITLP